MKIKSLFALAMVGVLSACGGGSGGTTDDAGQDDQQQATTTSYLGAASAGDFAEFSMDSDGQLSYSLRGFHFDGATGTIDTTNIAGGFYTATVDGNPLGLFMTSNLGLAVLPDEGSQAPFIAGLANSSTDVNEIADKDYIFIEWSGEASAALITLNADGTLEAKSIEDVVSEENGGGPAFSIEGCWAKSPNGDYINALTEYHPSYVDLTSCESIDETNTDDGYLRAVIKPGTSRAGFVVDFANGAGFGIGLERKVLQETPADIPYDIFSMNFADIAFDENNFQRFVVHSDDTADNTGRVTEYEYDCTMDGCTLTDEVSETFTVHYNQVCAEDHGVVGAAHPDLLPFDGMACVVADGSGVPAGAMFNALVDIDDGYFIANLVNTSALDGVDFGGADPEARFTLGAVASE